MKKRPKESKKGDMSINDLAVIVGEGFNKVYGRFDEVEKRFDEVEKRIDALELEIKDMNRRLDIIEHKLIERHDREIEQLRDRLLKIETKLSRQK